MSEENRISPAFPIWPAEVGFEDLGIETGLTKREWFAGLAIHGCAGRPEPLSPQQCAKAAVLAADALLAELAKEASNAG